MKTNFKTPLLVQGEVSATAEVSTTKSGGLHIEIPKQVRVLDRLQFEQSNLPGSKLARALVKPESQPVSLKRMVGMGLLGGAAGFGAAKFFNTRKDLGAGLGAALGAGSSIAYDKLKNASDAEVVGVITDEEGGSLIIVGPDGFSQAVKEQPRTLAPRLSNRAQLRYPQLSDKARLKYPQLSATRELAFQPLFISNPNLDEPPGWAGVIIQHGIMTQTAQLKYVYDHAKYRTPTQVGPDKGYDTSGWGQKTARATAETVVFSGASADYKNKTLYTNRFAEWPSPAWPNYGIGANYGFGDLNIAIRGIYQSKMMPALAVGSYTRSKLWPYLTDLKTYPYRNIPAIDSSWATPEAAPELHKRYNRMIRNAQWFVWAAEMYRLHSGTSALSLTQEWGDHCIQWGIRPATPDRVLRHELMNKFNSSSWVQSDTNQNPFVGNVKASMVDEYLKLVMKHTPAPFTSKFNEQMTLNDGNRMMLDYPSDLMNSFNPPVDQVDPAYFAAVMRRWGAKGQSKSFRWFLTIFMAVIDIVVTYVAGPIGMVLTAFTSVITTVLQMALNSPGGRIRMSAGDIARLVGGMLSSVAEAFDLSLDEILAPVTEKGSQFLSMLQGFEQLAKESKVFQDLQAIKDIYAQLGNTFNWHYMDQYLSTVQDAGRSVGMGVDAVNKKLDNMV